MVKFNPEDRRDRRALAPEAPFCMLVFRTAAELVTAKQDFVIYAKKHLSIKTGKF